MLQTKTQPLLWTFVHTHRMELGVSNKLPKSQLSQSSLLSASLVNHYHFVLKVQEDHFELLLEQCGNSDYSESCSIQVYQFLAPQHIEKCVNMTR